MKEIIHFIKTNFQRSENGVMKIMIINALIFIALLLIKAIFVLSGYGPYYYQGYQYLILPSSWEHFLYRPWTLLTYFFTHEDFFSFLFHLLLFYTFGKIIQDYLGSKKVVFLYILGGLAGGITFLLLYNISPRFQDIDTELVGAAGAVYAIMVGAATFVPNRSFPLFLFGVIKIKYIVLFFLLFPILKFLGNHPTEESIAHLGGALLGYMYIRQLTKGVDICKPFTQFLIRLKKSRTSMKVTYRYSNKQKNYIHQEEIDSILDKIAEAGYESLTNAEKQALFKAGKQKS